MRRRYSKDKKFVQIVEQMLDSGFNPRTDTPEEIEEDSEYAVADDLSSYYGISEKQAIYFVWTLLEDFVKKVIKGDREEKELLYGDDDYDYTPSRNKGRPQTRFVGTPDITVIDVKGFVRWVEKTFGVSEFPIKSYRNRKDPSDFDSRRRYASGDIELQEGPEEVLCDPNAPMHCEGVLRFKRGGKPIPTSVMLRGYLTGIALAQNDIEIVRKYGFDVMANLDGVIRGWLRKAERDPEYTLSDVQKKWVNGALGGKTPRGLSDTIRKAVIRECKLSGGCDLPEPDRFRFANNRRRAYGDYEDHEYFSYDRMSVDEYLDGLDDFEITTPLHGTVRVRSSDKATKMALQTVKAFNQLQRASARVARIDAEYDDTQYKSDLYLEQGKYGLYSKAEKRLDALSREFDKAEKAYAKLTSKYPDLVGLKSLDYEIFIWADDLEELHFDLKSQSFPFSARLKDYLDIDPTEY